MFRTLSITFLFLTLGFILNCSGDKLTAGLGIYQVLIHVVDEGGDPLSPDRVFWYYPPSQQENVKEYDAECANDECTVFRISGAKDGQIYVGARYSREHPSPLCWYTGYNTRQVHVTSGRIQEVTLALSERETCA